MRRLERYREQLAKLDEKRIRLLRSGRYLESSNLSNDMREIEMLIRQAEEYEEATKPRQIKDIVSEDELHEMGIIPLMIECHLIADMLVGVSYEIVDICKKHGFEQVSFMDDLKNALKANEVFSTFLTKLSPELCNLLISNDTLNEALHKKYLSYIKQRLKPKTKKKNDQANPR